MISIREILKYLKKNPDVVGKGTKKHGQKASTCSKLLTLKEKLNDARTKNKVLEKKISRKDVDLF